MPFKVAVKVTLISWKVSVELYMINACNLLESSIQEVYSLLVLSLYYMQFTRYSDGFVNIFSALFCEISITISQLTDSRLIAYNL